VSEKTIFYQQGKSLTSTQVWWKKCAHSNVIHTSCLMNSSRQIEHWTLTAVAVLAVAFPFDGEDSCTGAARGLCATNDGSSSPNVLEGRTAVIWRGKPRGTAPICSPRSMSASYEVSKTTSETKSPKAFARRFELILRRRKS
jgi:hypothetical protein